MLKMAITLLDGGHRAPAIQEAVMLSWTQHWGSWLADHALALGNCSPLKDNDCCWAAVHSSRKRMKAETWPAIKPGRNFLFPKISTKIRFLAQGMSEAAVPWLNVHPLNVLLPQELQGSFSQSGTRGRKSTYLQVNGHLEPEQHVHHLPSVDFFSLPFCSISCFIRRCSSWMSSCWKVARAFLAWQS